MPRWTVRTLSLLLLVFALVSPIRGGENKPPRSGPDDAELAPFDDMMEKFIADNEVPGAAVAVTKDGRLVYARGFGFADPDSKLGVQPRSRFRIASISKPITAAAILRLVEMGKLKLDDAAFDVLKVEPPDGAEVDPRLKKVTIRQLLQHTGGWDRAVSFDPMFRPIKIAETLKVDPPAGPESVVRYMMGQKLDFDPGSRYAYSNFGYCVLGRIIEKASGKGYEAFVRDEVLTPLKMNDTQLGKTLETAKGEVRYFEAKNRTGPAVVGPKLGAKVPLPYGTWYLEAMDSHGGWISTAPDLVRFASAFDHPDRCPILKKDSITALFARPDGLAGHDKKGNPKDTFYALGWNVKLDDKGFDASHNGALDGTATLLTRRKDGLCWAVLFNARANPRGQYLGTLIGPRMSEAAGQVKTWPARDLFTKGL